MKASKLFMMMVLGAAMLMSACGKSSDDDTSISSRAGRPGPSESYEPFDDGHNFYTAEIGKITPATGQVGIFETLMRNLLSAAMAVNSDTVGSISTGAVSFQGQVELTSTTSLDPNYSSILIRIEDSLSKEEGGPLEIGISGKKASVQVNGSSYIVTFADDYGSVTFNGTLSADHSTYSGNFNYDNYKNDHHATGVLKFSVPTCGFFVCSK